jgi:flotillin
MFGFPVIPMIAGFAVLAVLLIMITLAKMYRKVGPHEALIIYGTGSEARIVKGSGTIIWPMVQTCRELSLELMSFDVAPQQSLYTQQGVAVTVEAVAQIKVKSDPVSIRTAAEQFLTKRPEQREGLIRLVMEGHLRGIIGQLTVEQIVKEPEMVADRMRPPMQVTWPRWVWKSSASPSKKCATRKNTSPTWAAPTSRAFAVTPK